LSFWRRAALFASRRKLNTPTDYGRSPLIVNSGTIEAESIRQSSHGSFSDLCRPATRWRQIAEKWHWPSIRVSPSGFLRRVTRSLIQRSKDVVATRLRSQVRKSKPMKKIFLNSLTRVVLATFASAATKRGRLAFWTRGCTFRTAP
jgi:hypothetical protein